ncbi:MAG: hypothetical protein HXY34_11705 [Candidatus Thorarchaeota archaeon]|nr:hypothetical protein [Candidatus Thorarchaeota archaeon]
MSEGLKWLQCPVCKETIYWKAPLEALKEVKRFPIPIVIRHNDHFLVCYIDSQYQIADTEVAVSLVDATAKKT